MNKKLTRRVKDKNLILKNYPDYLNILSGIQKRHGFTEAKVVLMPVPADNLIKGIPEELMEDHYGRPYFIDNNDDMIIFITPKFYKSLGKKTQKRIFKRIFRRKPLGSLLGLEDD